MITRAKLEARLKQLWSFRKPLVEGDEMAAAEVAGIIKNIAEEMVIPNPDEQTSAGDLLRILRKLKDYRKELEDHASEIEKIEKRIQFDLGPAAFERAGIEEKLTEKGVGSAKLDIDTKAYVRKEHQEAWFDWLRNNGVGAIIKETIHHTTLSKTVDDLTLQGVELPEYVQVTRRECWGFRRNNS